MFTKLKKNYFTGAILAGSFFNGKLHVGRDLKNFNEEHDVTISKHGCTINGKRVDIDLYDGNATDKMLNLLCDTMEFSWMLPEDGKPVLNLTMRFKSGALFDVYAVGFSEQLLADCEWTLNNYNTHLFEDPKSHKYGVWTVPHKDERCHMVLTSRDEQEIMLSYHVLHEVALTDKEIKELY